MARLRHLMVELIVGASLLSGSAVAQADEPPPPPAGVTPAPLTDGPAEMEAPQKPSGFWTSSRPAKGGAYRYRMLGIGVVLAGITGCFLVRAMRRANRSRPDYRPQVARPADDQSV